MATRTNDSMLSGVAAGAVGTIVGFPLDTLKAHLQTGQQGERASITRAASSIYARAGLKGFYSGVAAPLVSLALTSSVNFSVYNTFRALLGGSSASVVEGRAADRHTLVAGALVGPVLAGVNTPLELVKIQLQVRGAYRSAPHALWAVWRAGGLRALYTGLGVNVLRESAFGCVYFSAYELGANVLGGPLGLPMAAAVPVAGGCAGLLAWVAALPLDTVKSVVQAQDMKAHASLTPARAAAQVWRAQGPAGFMRGALPSVVRAFLVNAVRLSVYEAMLAGFKRGRRACEEERRQAADDEAPSLVCRYLFSTSRI